MQFSNLYLEHFQMNCPQVVISQNWFRKQAIINTLRPRQNGRHFPDDIFKSIFLNENARISFKISLKFVPKVRINNIPALVQIMAWRRPGDKPLSEPMMVSLLTHICVTWPQWVNKANVDPNLCLPIALLGHNGLIVWGLIKPGLACHIRTSFSFKWIFLKRNISLIIRHCKTYQGFYLTDNGIRHDFWIHTGVLNTGPTHFLSANVQTLLSVTMWLGFITISLISSLVIGIQWTLIRNWFRQWMVWFQASNKPLT